LAMGRLASDPAGKSAVLACGKFHVKRRDGSST
jgi:hypothetical protein